MTTRTTAPPPPKPPAAPPSAAPPSSGPTQDTPPAPPSPPPPAPPADVVTETAGSGTHEFECTSCGYILFPAAGREFKFFGDDFTCPQCGADKDAFVDNGPVDD